MAKKPKTIGVAGLSVTQIINMDVNTLGEKDLRTVATRLVSAANKRIRRLEKSAYGKLSPAYQQIKKQGRQFSVKGKDLSRLRAEMGQMRKFLQKKTSTVTGWKKVRTNMEKSMGGTLTENEVSKFWSLYHKLEEEGGGAIGALYDSDKIQKKLHSEVVKGNEEEDILEKMRDFMNQDYEDRMKEEEDEEQAINDIFDFEGVF